MMPLCAILQKQARPSAQACGGLSMRRGGRGHAPFSSSFHQWGLHWIWWGGEDMDSEDWSGLTLRGRAGTVLGGVTMEGHDVEQHGAV
jgi:hypothetical protein